MLRAGNAALQIRNDILKHWEGLLREWTLCFEQFCLFSETMPALSKREATNVEILAGAAWRIGLVAFQEMSRKKAGLGGYGYNDLYICSAGHNVSDYIECKGGWVQDVATANHLLATACQDATALDTEDTYSIKVGVAFCNFFCPDIDEAHINNNIDKLLEAMRAIPSDAMAWCFPQGRRTYRDDLKTIPGVVLLARVVN